MLFKVLNVMELCESIWCKIYVEGIDYFLISVCYQSQEADENELGEMFESIKLACDANRSVLVMGDFKYHVSIGIH